MEEVRGLMSTPTIRFLLVMTVSQFYLFEEVGACSSVVMKKRPELLQTPSGFSAYFPMLTDFSTKQTRVRPPYPYICNEKNNDHSTPEYKAMLKEMMCYEVVAGSEAKAMLKWGCDCADPASLTSCKGSKKPVARSGCTLLGTMAECQASSTCQWYQSGSLPALIAGDEQMTDFYHDLRPGPNALYCNTVRFVL